jgi:paraquat-inducible protein B
LSEPDRAADAAPPPAWSALPEPVLGQQNRLRMSLVWIVPIVAVIIGAVLVVRTILAAGPEITIEFRSAEGIDPGHTEVRFKEVVVGRVKRVRLGADRQRVQITVNLDKSVANIAVDDTRFWVVRPRIGTGGVSGLGTLLSGAYIGVDAGASEEPRREFTGLDTPPLVLRGEPGRSFVLQSDELGSLDVGSPIYHRGVRVGRVVGYALDASGSALDVQIFVEAPHEPLVTQQSRFWNASGIDVSLSASGLTISTQSIASVLAGGLAFGTPPTAASANQAAPGRRFKLFADQRAAMARDDLEALRVRMVFDQSMRGLEPGAVVDLHGIEIGTVRSVAPLPDAKATRLPMEVFADIYPALLGRLRERSGTAQADTSRSDRRLLRQLVERGLRAQVRSGNLLTGQQYIALDFMPKTARAPFDAMADVPTLPTVPGALNDVQAQLAEIAGRLSKVRFDEIGNELQGTLKTVNATGASLQTALASADTMIRQLTPEAKRALVDVQQTLATAQQALTAAQQTLRSADQNLTDAQAPLQRSATQTMVELQRAAQALRVLADYLQRNPESLLRGKAADPGGLEPPR